MFAEHSRRRKAPLQAYTAAALLALLAVQGMVASACSEIPHCWYPLASDSAASLENWLARDLIERMGRVLGDHAGQASVRSRESPGPGLDDAVLTREAAATGLEWKLGDVPGKPVMEFEVRSDSGTREVNGDPYCLWGPTLQCRETRSATVRYLALSGSREVIGIDELSLKAMSTIDWSWHGFVPAGCILLRKVELVFGESPWMVSMWLGQGSLGSPASGVATSTVAATAVPVETILR